VHEDVTQQRLTEARIKRLARQDTLTGLANRHVLREEMEARCAASKPFALLLIDLDRFKQVNDTLGHPVGDALLQAVGERLQRLTRSSDVVARLGGDEFAVLQDAAATQDAAETLAVRLIDRVSERYHLADQRVSIGASVGIARFPADGSTSSMLLGNADLALYASKADGRGIATTFEATMKEAALAERALEADLRTALTESQFELFFQPILSLETRRVTSCEALLRWRHPTRGLVPPLDFIPFAEQSGLIVPIGRWALRRACEVAATWPEHVGVAVNLSAIQVLSGDLVGDVEAVLADTGLAAGRLELEVTETLLLGDEPATRETLFAVRERGVHIALDDFGTGYASLGYLRRFPFDKLKIDQMFVRDITDQQASTAIVRAVASLAKSLDITAVAEGVETKAHLARVAAAGCTQVQGYLFSRPVPAHEIAQVIETCSVPALAETDWIEAASAA
jgi:diguanylate cyclase (GGDEF)-like protein